MRYNKMQEEVAREVKDGRRDEALQTGAIGSSDETAAMNARVQSAPVAAQLESADKLEADVSGAFDGAGSGGSGRTSSASRRAPRRSMHAAPAARSESSPRSSGEREADPKLRR